MPEKGEQIGSGRLVRFRPEGGELTFGELDLEGRIWECTDYFQPTPVYTGRDFLIGEVNLAAPSSPSKLIGVGINYRDHAQEMGHELPEDPVLFLIAPSAIIAHEEEIMLPPEVLEVEYEAELAVVIGKQCRMVAPEDVEDVILGYTCFNDVTTRQLQRRDGQWARAKSFDTFAPLGPWIQQELDPSELPIQLFLNGELKQSSNTRELIFDVPTLISTISKAMTLYPGDVIATGTPSGVGPLSAGDVVTVMIGGLGYLENKVGV